MRDFELFIEEIEKEIIKTSDDKKKMFLLKILELYKTNDIDILEIAQNSHNLSKEFQIEDKLLTSDKYLEIINNAIETFFDKTFTDTLNEAIEISKKSYSVDLNKVVENGLDHLDKNKKKIIGELILKNKTEISDELIDKGTESLEEYLEQVLIKQIAGLKKLFEKNIFSMIGNYLSNVEKEELLLLQKSLEIKSKLEKKYTKELEKEFIQLWDVSEYSEALLKQNSILRGMILQINKLESVKDLFGPLFKVSNIEKIIAGGGTGIMTSIMYKIAAESVLHQLVKVNTNTSFLTKYMTTKELDQNQELIDTLSKINSTNDLNKDLAVSYLLLDIKTSIETNDLIHSRNYINKMTKPFKSLVKNIQNLFGSIGEKEDEFKELEEKLLTLDKTIVKEIEERTNKYISEVENLGKILEEKQKTITSSVDNVLDSVFAIENEIETLFTNINNMSDNSITVIEQINNSELLKKIEEGEIEHILNKGIETLSVFQENIENMILESTKIVNDLTDNLKTFQSPEEAIRLEEEIIKHKEHLEKLEKELNNIKIKKDNLSKIALETFKLTEISDSIKLIKQNSTDIVGNKDKIEEEISKIKLSLEETKSTIDFSKEKETLKGISDLYKKDLEDFIKLPQKLIETIKKESIKFFEVDTIKKTKTNIVEMFGLSKEGKKYLEDSAYLKNVMEILERYGYKKNILEYINSLRKTEEEKSSSYFLIINKTKEINLIINYLNENIDKELEVNGKNKEEYRYEIENYLKKLINEIEIEKKQLLTFLINETGVSREYAMSEIDEELSNLLNGIYNIKEDKLLTSLNENLKETPELNNYMTRNERSFVLNELRRHLESEITSIPTHYSDNKHPDTMIHYKMKTVKQLLKELKKSGENELKLSDQRIIQLYEKHNPLKEKYNGLNIYLKHSQNNKSYITDWTDTIKKHEKLKGYEKKSDENETIKNIKKRIFPLIRKIDKLSEKLNGTAFIEKNWYEFLNKKFNGNNSFIGEILSNISKEYSKKLSEFSNTNSISSIGKISFKNGKIYADTKVYVDNNDKRILMTSARAGIMPKNNTILEKTTEIKDFFKFFKSQINLFVEGQDFILSDINNFENNIYTYLSEKKDKNEDKTTLYNKQYETLKNKIFELFKYNFDFNDNKEGLGNRIKQIISEKIDEFKEKDKNIEKDFILLYKDIVEEIKSKELKHLVNNNNIDKEKRFQEQNKGIRKNILPFIKELVEKGRDFNNNNNLIGEEGFIETETFKKLKNEIQNIFIESIYGEIFSTFSKEKQNLIIKNIEESIILKTKTYLITSIDKEDIEKYLTGSVISKLSINELLDGEYTNNYTKDSLSKIYEQHKNISSFENEMSLNIKDFSTQIIESISILKAKSKLNHENTHYLQNIESLKSVYLSLKNNFPNLFTKDLDYLNKDIFSLLLEENKENKSLIKYSELLEKRKILEKEISTINDSNNNIRYNILQNKITKINSELLNIEQQTTKELFVKSYLNIDETLNQDVVKNNFNSQISNNLLSKNNNIEKEVILEYMEKLDNTKKETSKIILLGKFFNETVQGTSKSFLKEQIIEVFDTIKEFEKRSKKQGPQETKKIFDFFKTKIELILVSDSITFQFNENLLKTIKEEIKEPKDLYELIEELNDFEIMTIDKKLNERETKHYDMSMENGV